MHRTRKAENGAPMKMSVRKRTLLDASLSR
jgi:hypothetical protein